MKNKNTLMRDLTRCCFIPIMFCSFSFVVLADDVSENKLRTDQFEYVYKNYPVTEEISNEVLYNKGEITIEDVGNKQLLYKEITALQPGLCEGFLPLSRLKYKTSKSQYLGGEPEEEITVLCGSIGGRHMSLKVFFEASEGIRTATLDFDNTSPNLVNFENSLKSVVHRRLFFDDIGYSNMPYIFVYSLNLDSSTLGFSVIYGGIAEIDYRSYYESIFNKIDNSNRNYDGQAIAALFSTKNEKYICQQHTGLEKKVGRDSMKEWKKRLQLANFPIFNLDICEDN